MHLFSRLVRCDKLARESERIERIAEASMDPATVMQAIQAWPMEDQVAFACQLWEQVIESGWEAEISEEWKAELDRRLAAYRADPTNVLTWEQVLARVRRER
jgi:putative addiction module component (TIGR02574 family)